MTPEAQRIAIAEACGWRFENYGPTTNPTLYWRAFNPAGELVQKDFTGDDWRSVYVPNYHQDLNAMHEAEKVIVENPVLLAEYKNRLYAPEPRGCGGLAIHATAAQRAEAFLRTLNLYTDED